jgi:hypothetical protein
MPALFLGKLVEMASIKRERAQFNKCSTSTCGLCGKILSEHTLLEF